MTEKLTIIDQLQPFLQEAWHKAEFTTPTTIQSEAIPYILQGRDVVAESPTGTGKTLAYLLPVLNKIDPKKQNPQVVILASSQELVMQILSEVQKWGEGSQIKSTSLIGGANLKRQLEKLKKSPQLIVGTPGRTLELIKQKKLKMHEVKTIVLDEGDQLLVPEHFGTVENITKSTLADRQVILFSATLPEQTEQKAKALTKDAEIVRVKKDETIQSGQVDHLYFTADQREKIKLLEKISRLDSIKALVFMKDIASMTVTAEKLDYNEIKFSLLHSDLNKDKRKNALKDFRTGKTNMLLATDVAARGLDITGVTHVVHYDFPRDINQYVHRSGRTARFGASGTIVSIVNNSEERDLKRFAKELNIQVNQVQFYKGKIVNSEGE